MQVSKAEFKWMLGSAVLAASPVACYHLINREYPCGDEAEYMWVALSIYRRFFTEGLLGGLRSIYTFRCWKPIIHPILALPAFFLSHGRVLPAQALVMVPLYVAFAVVLYTLFRTRLGRFDSALATILLGTIPWMSRIGLALDSELPFAVFFLGGWAALFHSGCLQKRTETLLGGVLLGLAICTRPIESALFLGFTLPAFGFFLSRNGKLNQREAGSTLLLTLLFVAPGIIIGLREHLPWRPPGDLANAALFAFFVVAAWTLWAARLRRGGRSNILFLVLIMLTIPAIWFAGFIPGLMNWAASTSFRSGGIDQFERVGFSNLLHDMKDNFFGPLSLGLVILVALFSRASWKVGAKPGVPSALGVLGVLILTFAVHFILGARSYNPVLRYYLVEIIGLYTCAILIFLESGRMQRLMRIAVSTLAIWQLAVYLPGFGILPSHPFLTGSLAGGVGVAPVLTKEDPGLSLYRTISPDLSAMKTEKIPRVLVYLTNPTDSRGLGRVMERLHMNLIALEDSREIDMRWWGALLVKNGKTDYFGLENPAEADFLLAGPLELAQDGMVDEFKKYGSSSKIFLVDSDSNYKGGVSVLWVKR